MYALITDVHLRSVVAGIRALGQAGVPILSVAPSRSGAGLRSRWTTRTVVAPDPARDEHGFTRAITALAAEHGPLVVYPGRERSIDAVLSTWHELGTKAVMAYPGAGPLEQLRDKRRLEELAHDVGLSAPATLACATAAEMLSIRLPTPCVLKPVVPSPALRTARILETQPALRAALLTVPGDQPLLVQAHVRGNLHSVAVVVGRDGRLVERFQQIAIRTWPVTAGASALARSVPPDEDLATRVGRMLASVGYWGMAQVQLFGDGDDLSVIDVNPRFFGSLPLALASGVNLPAAWHAVATGAPTGAPSAYRAGVTYRWLESELTAARHGRWEALLPPPRPRVGAMWASNDPLPGAILAAEALWRRVPAGIRHRKRPTTGQRGERRGGDSRAAAISSAMRP